MFQRWIVLFTFLKKVEELIGKLMSYFYTVKWLKIIWEGEIVRKRNWKWDYPRYVAYLIIA
jgi:hypothetical protein